MKRTIAIILAVLLTLTLFAGCSAKYGNKNNGKLNIVVKMYPEYDFVRAIAGDKVNLDMLVPPGGSVHSYEPSPGDIVKIQNADMFIYVGGESDSWVSDILDSMDTSGMTILRLIDYVDAFEEEIKEGMEAEDEDEDNDEIEYDEHIWTSPKNAILLINVIRDAICDMDADNCPSYVDNARTYQEELRDIDTQLTELVKNAARKKIVVADKFPFLYFVRHYGLDYEAAFPGCSDQADATPKTIQHLKEAVQNEKIPYVYHVELSNKSVASSISEMTGAGMLLLNSCHNVSKDDFKKGVTYVDLMRVNIENLRKGLN